jgi:hypothetical protein
MPSYVENRLRPGERVIYQARLSWFLLVINGLIGLVCLVVFGFFGLKAVAYAGKFNWKFLKGPVSSDEALLAVFLIFFTGLCLYFICKYFYDYFRSEIAVTDQRIIGIVPRLLVAFSLQPVDLPLSALEKVYYTMSGGSSSGSGSASLIADIVAIIIVAIADYGTVVVVDKEGRKTKFRSVVAPK